MFWRLSFIVDSVLYLSVLDLVLSLHLANNNTSFCDVLYSESVNGTRESPTTGEFRPYIEFMVTLPYNYRVLIN